jgi:hypothetical protein
MKRLLLLLFISFLTSCACDICCIDCGTQGRCDDVDGTCICNKGFMLDAEKKCGRLVTSQFITARQPTLYECIDTCNFDTTAHYIVVLKLTSDITGIHMSNFAQSGLEHPVKLQAGFRELSFLKQSFQNDSILATTNNQLPLPIGKNDTLTLLYKHKKQGGSLQTGTIWLRKI